MGNIMCHTHNFKGITATSFAQYKLLLPFSLCVRHEIVTTKRIFNPRWQSRSNPSYYFFFFERLETLDSMMLYKV